ncbi:polysaccharide pyruvyl transferase family protein [Sphingobacterium daejeonense]|uniref:Polysaccharide pyruvyl transferase family protein n=1 Tax=Sphingobacterium daejeonense TaxID=371142 RepID=A0ABW3RMN8_9SPHI
MSKQFELISEKYIDHNKVNRIFILGSANGSGNLGDEAMFESITGYFQHKYPQIKITTDVTKFPFESVYPNVDKKLPMYGSVKNYRTYYKLIEFYGLKYIGLGFYNFWSKIFKSTELTRYKNEFENCDYILFSGAGAINSRFRSYGIFGWGSLTYLAKAMKKNVFFSGHGIGPFSASYHENCAVSFLKDSTAVRCRDEISYSFLKEKGLNNITWGIDDAYFIEQKSNEEVEKILKANHVSENYIVLSFHQWNSSFDFNKFTKIAKFFLKKTNYQIVLLGNKIKPTMDDIPVLLAFKKEYFENDARVVVLEPPYTPQVSKGIIGKSKLLITTRYHPAIFSGEPNIPCIALSFDPYYYQKFVGALAGRDNVLNLDLNDNVDKNIDLIMKFSMDHKVINS